MQRLKINTLQFSIVNELVSKILADNALNARLPRHFAYGRNEGKARGVGFLREGGDQDPPSLKPPLEVLETFGGAKVSDDDQL
jgi:hypothetical protein